MTVSDGRTPTSECKTAWQAVCSRSIRGRRRGTYLLAEFRAETAPVLSMLGRLESASMYAISP